MSILQQYGVGVLTMVVVVILFQAMGPRSSRQVNYRELARSWSAAVGTVLLVIAIFHREPWPVYLAILAGAHLILLAFLLRRWR